MTYPWRTKKIPIMLLATLCSIAMLLLEKIISDDFSVCRSLSRDRLTKNDKNRLLKTIPGDLLCAS